MTVSTVAHLNFRGDAREALEFYRSVFGGELMIVTNDDLGGTGDPDEGKQVKWGQVEADNGFRIMAFDVPAARAWDRGEDSVFVAVRGDSGEEIGAMWEKLAAGATIREQLAPAPWGPLYGMLDDRFGITWVLDVAVPYDAS